MGDRTSVSLTVLTAQAEDAKRIFGEAEFEVDHMSSDGGLSHFSFYEINYGNLPFLDELQNAGIAFDSCWDHGGDYGAGSDRCRFLSDGSVYRFETSDEYLNPDLHMLMKLLDRPEELKAFIIEHYDKVTPPSWDHQVEYGKLYKTKLLINPD